jgi:DHA1 family multidrug resistance protein-like MFS transporter
MHLPHLLQENICSHFWKMECFDHSIFFNCFFTFATPFIDTKGWLCIIQGLNGFSQGFLFPLLGMDVESISHEKRATAMGIYQALYAIGMFAGPFLAGALNSRMGLVAGFYFAGTLGLIATILITYWKKENKFIK